MLTKTDLQNIVEVLTPLFVTREEFHDKLDKFISDNATFKDMILYEIKSMREEFWMITGHRDMLDDHENRIEKLEESIKKKGTVH